MSQSVKTYSPNPRKSKAKTLRIFRKLHRTTGALLFAFFFVMSVTGLLLGWKKHSGGYITAKSYSGSTKNLNDFLPLDTLQAIAVQTLKDSVSNKLTGEVDRIDIRNGKGMVKFIFVEDYWAIQLDGATGKPLLIEKRRGDFIEQIHDGSFIDRYLGISNQWFKLFYTTVMGLALLLFTVTGFWLWLGPKRMKQDRKKASRELME